MAMNKADTLRETTQRTPKNVEIQQEGPDKQLAQEKQKRLEILPTKSAASTQRRTAPWNEPTRVAAVLVHDRNHM